VTYPEEAITWVRDLSTYRRSLTQGDEINVDLEHWKTVRPEEPPSYKSELVNNLYFSTPERCVDRIAALQRQHGIDYFGASFSFGAMAHAKVMASMKLFAEQVMPKFQ
jgi:alkanesulfonate monooxygenase SsuD/methylene tetrahydromethanopterin reductase-like flavin-dependent oxidoreductase (luciferase family)